jgi:hypothetical protein
MTICFGGRGLPERAFSPRFLRTLHWPDSHGQRLEICLYFPTLASAISG